MTFDLKGFSEEEISQMITALAMQVPLIAKISMQVTEQKKALGNGEGDPLPSPIKRQKPAEKHE